MDHLDLPDWAARARPVETPILEVGFSISKSFYYGPDTCSQSQWLTLREPVYQPALELHRIHVNHVLTSVLESSTDEMVKHYADVLRVAEKHGKQADDSCFWLSPILFAPGDLEIKFAWHDTRGDAEWFFSALEGTPAGQVYNDLGAGWELDVWASGGRLFIRHGDGDGRERDCISCDRDVLVRQVAPLRARLDRILGELRAALGKDYWSAPTHGSGPGASRFPRRSG